MVKRWLADSAATWGTDSVGIAWTRPLRQGRSGLGVLPCKSSRTHRDGEAERAWRYTVAVVPVLKKDDGGERAGVATDVDTALRSVCLGPGETCK